MKSPLKQYFKMENGKNGSATTFLVSFFRYLQEKIANFSLISVSGDHIVLISKTDDIKDYR